MDIYEINSEAGRKLNGILDNYDEQLSKKVNKHLHKYYQKINHINHNSKYYNYFLTLVLKDTESIVKTYGYPTEVETFLLNVITCIYREKLK